MLRNLAAALALTLLSQMAMALGLGTLKQSSGLNEPFNARIDIISATADDLDTILVRLADAEQFKRAGVGRDGVLLQLRFKVVEGASGADYIQISSREAIREPFLNFLLELNWAKGRIVREYTVLLDPPLYDPVRRQAPSAAVVSAPTPIVADPTPEPEPLAPPVETSPLTVMVESTQEPTEESVSVAESTTEYQDNSTLSPVEANQTLWSIASANVPDQSVSVQQMMLALLRANPEAFGDNNINILKRGAILRLPDADEIASISRGDAIAEVQHQHQLWNNYRDVATEDVVEVEQEIPTVDELDPEPSVDDSEIVTESPVDQEASPDVVDDPEPEVTQTMEQTASEEEPSGHLELVAPDSEVDEIATGTGSDGTAAVTLAQEELDAQVQENTELQARIAEANEIIDLMSRQVDIKDDELAALQSRLVEFGIEAPYGDVGTELGDPSDVDPMKTSDDIGEAVTTDEQEPVDSEITPDVDITFGDDEQSADPVVGDDSTSTPDVAEIDDGGGADSQLETSFLGGLIPDSISSMVPGGAMTVLGIVGAAILALIAIVVSLVRGKDDSDDEIVVGTDDDDVTAITEGLDDEPITETREDHSEEDSSEDTTEFAAEAMETSPDLQQQTLEASAEESAGTEESVNDPLEEVNVYLAYERFDQAEELVRNVISEHPEDHNYKLRLLEVFYSSNNKSAYEDEARVLHEAVGESDPLWESAVAMWAEMSPERALFEEPEAGAIEDVPADDSSAVVDITSQTQQPGGSTMTMAPGTDIVLESTQVGLGPAADQEDDDGRSLDFDIGGLEFETDDSNSSDETLDISGGLDFDGDATERNEEGLDLTIPDGSSVASPDEVDMVEMDAILPETSDLDHLAPSAEDDAELDLSLESPELDALVDDVGEALDVTGGDGGGDEASEIEFDLALENTTEIGRLVVDDTLDLPKSSTPDESLEDLAKSMEESMADLDLAEGIPNVEGEETGDLDLSLADTSGELDIDFDEMTGENAETKLDFDLDDIDLDDVDPADTLAMERSDLESVETANDLETMALPPDEFAPRQSDAGEVDTKLNLAKAYIELGENDGARSIIDEVARDGTDEQKAEAQRLIEQLD